MGAFGNVPAIQPIQPANPLQDYGQALSVQGMLQNRQLQQEQLKQQQIQTQQAQVEQKSQQAIMQAWKDANGDMMKAIPMAAKNGATPTDLVKLQTAAKQQQLTNLDLLTKQGDKALRDADLAQGVHDQISKLPEEQRPAAYQQGLQQLQQAGVDTSKIPPQYDPQMFQVQGVALRGHAAQLKDLAEQLGIQKTQGEIAGQQAALPGQQADAQQKVRANAASQLAAASDQASYDQLRGQMPHALAVQFPDKFDKDAVLQAGMTPSQVASVPIEKQEAKQYLKDNPGKTLSDYQVWKAQHSPTAIINNSSSISPEGLDFAADNYRRTGQLPSGLTRDPAATKAIISRAAEMDKQQGGAGLALNKSDIEANRKSLDKLQSMSDSVEAFENTAGKNLDQFLGTAKNVVDSGVPLVNTPLRMIARGTGGKDQAAYDAARQVALNEIAKVVSNPNLSGQLSDSARHEVEALNPQNATLAQTYRVAQILKQDMDNRRQSYQQQIQDIKGRIGGKSGSNQPSNGTHPLTIKLPSGQSVTIQ